MPEQTRHITSNFDRALYGLRNDVLMMSDLTGRIFQNASEGLLTRDRELCEHVIEEDKEIDNLEKQVDQDGVDVLIRFQPVASDMRAVISAMKISTDLERIADQSVRIARGTQRLIARAAVPEVQLLEPPSLLALEIFRDSIRAYADGDTGLALRLHLKAEELDALTRDLSEKFVERATVDSALVSIYLELVFVARALVRIGDHSTNIGEDSFWRDQAIDIRHTYEPKKVI